MAIPFSLVQLERFRREAKKRSRELSITHAEALDQIANQHNFTNWSLLAKHSHAASAPAVNLRRNTSRKAPTRFYLHGDQAEHGDPGTYYCARCDIFCDWRHFQDMGWHRDGKDVERYLLSLASWNRMAPAERSNLFRPADALNILQEAAEDDRDAVEAIRSPFHKWLETQQDRDDRVGDLAGDVISDRKFPVTVTTLHEVEAYLEQFGDHVLEAARQAWLEFEARDMGNSSERP